MDTYEPTKHFSDQQKYQIVKAVLSKTSTISQLSVMYHIPHRTLYNWVQTYKTKGMKGLNRKRRSDAGQSKVIRSEYRQLIEALYLHCPVLSMAAIYRQSRSIATQHSWPLVSYHTVCRVIKSIPEDITLLARHGSKRYAQSFDLIYKREATAANEIWQCDHTRLDIVLLDANDNPANPWLTIIIDDYSRVVCGYYLSFDPPCIVHTALAMRQAIWYKSDPRWKVCGIPKIFYTDNGRDFTSIHIDQVCIDLKIQSKFSIPGKPQGRGRVERFFLSLTQLFLQPLPGYKLGKRKVKPQLTLDAFDTLFLDFVINDYHHRIHSSIGQSPLARWSTYDFIPRMPQSVEQLDDLLMHHSKLRKVQRDGVHLNNYRYLHTDLSAHVGQTVIIKYDPRDMTSIGVYLSDKFICRAFCQRMDGHKVSLKQIIKARKTRSKTLKQHIAQRKTELDTYNTSLHTQKTSTWIPTRLYRPKYDDHDSQPIIKLYYEDHRSND